MESQVSAEVGVGDSTTPTAFLNTIEDARELE